MTEFIPSSSTDESTLHINVKRLTFQYSGVPRPILRDLNMQLTAGARCLLIGANGSGKSTLLRILAGRHLSKPDGAVTVLGKSAFHDTSLNFERSYLDTEWGLRTVSLPIPSYSSSSNYQTLPLLLRWLSLATVALFRPISLCIV
jgi:ABC-type cobalamin/Fe3+-siderophores transport system ATPase subunit